MVAFGSLGTHATLHAKPKPPRRLRQRVKSEIQVPGARQGKK